jgi:hypothetical protein
MELTELGNQRPRVRREWFPDWPHQRCDFELEASGLVTYGHQARQASPIEVAHSLLLQRQYHVVGSRFATYGLLGLVGRVERDLDYLAPPIQALQVTGPYFCNQSAILAISDDRHTCRLRLRLCISQRTLSTAQLAHGGPDKVTVHLTLRALQALHATWARLCGLSLLSGIVFVAFRVVVVRE